MLQKYEVILILTYLRDEMNCKEDAEIIQNLMTDFIESDLNIIKKKFCLI